jgi:16S rRNA processing protein RimM
MVLVGIIARPHGLRGQVIVAPETDFVEQRFAAGATLWTKDEALTIDTVRIQNGRPVVGFQGFARIEDVGRLVGLELRVPEEALLPLAAGSYYQHQLVGCDVETMQGERVGTVTRVDGGAAGSLLVVDGSRGELLIPMAAGFLAEIDVEAKRIRIDPPDGLLELNSRT